MASISDLYALAGKSESTYTVEIDGRKVRVKCDGHLAEDTPEAFRELLGEQTQLVPVVAETAGKGKGRVKRTNDSQDDTADVLTRFFYGEPVQSKPARKGKPRRKASKPPTRPAIDPALNGHG